ncbi:hypothetical protein MIR68_006525 [Amoeboaphelidium protococcarum]|nr:hypothetical protein MIR68_006525 [Amoeboaphelidium protococcarum]
MRSLCIHIDQKQHSYPIRYLDHEGNNGGSNLFLENGMHVELIVMIMDIVDQHCHTLPGGQVVNVNHAVAASNDLKLIEAKRTQNEVYDATLAKAKVRNRLIEAETVPLFFPRAAGDIGGAPPYMLPLLQLPQQIRELGAELRAASNAQFIQMDVNVKKLINGTRGDGFYSSYEQVPVNVNGIPHLPTEAGLPALTSVNVINQLTIDQLRETMAFYGLDFEAFHADEAEQRMKIALLDHIGNITKI